MEIIVIRNTESDRKEKPEPKPLEYLDKIPRLQEVEITPKKTNLEEWVDAGFPSL